MNRPGSIALLLCLLLGLLGPASPARALDAKPLLYSLLLPGMGELSLGYKGRATIFFAVEATAWAGNFYYRQQGTDQRAEYEAYADAHWHEARWRSAYLGSARPDTLHYSATEWELYWWMSQEDWDAHAWDSPRPTAVEFDEGHPYYLNNHFAPYHEDPQHYYENLGKYDWYRWGWDDYDTGTDASQNRVTYVTMRRESNDSFETAHKFVMLMVIGRVVSVADTYLLLRRQENENRDQESRADLRRSWRVQFTPTGLRANSGFRMMLTRSW